MSTIKYEVLYELKELIMDVRKLVNQFIDNVEENTQCTCNNDLEICNYCQEMRFES